MFNVSCVYTKHFVQIECVVETRGGDHAEKLRIAAMNKYGKKFIKWGRP